jgi:hypothetical protein
MIRELPNGYETVLSPRFQGDLTALDRLLPTATAARPTK